jgi:predicted short-subunit dehydrogenase-like oxidoreductase (DUF2520 family)
MNAVVKQHSVIIGAGNLAYQLSKALCLLPNMNVSIVHHRSTPTLKKIAKETNGKLYTSYTTLPNTADFYFLCVSDTAIKKVAATILPSIKSGILCHCAGSTPLISLKNEKLSYGVLYPLQSFSVNRLVNWKEIPILVEGSTKPTEKLLLNLAKQLSEKTLSVTSEKRLLFHLSALFVNNFTNALLIAASEQLSKKEFQLLKPLANETISKAFALSPQQAQTGPAKRKDTKILTEHKRLLKSNPEALAIYKALTQFITQHFKN